MQILDQHGQPIDRGVLKAPQTSRIASLANQFIQSGAARNLSPAKIGRALAAADEGDLLTQADMFDDMLERDAHLSAEMAKRHLAILGLDWDILPPRNASAAEKKNAAWVKEVLQDTPEFGDLLLSMMQAVGHGFAPIELEWRQDGKEFLPSFAARPQNWFRLDTTRREFRLADASTDGQALLPFGWIMHTAREARTGYLGRLGLMRTLAWPWLYKNYSIGDFAEFLESYGLPIIVGKYQPGATDAEKDTLLAAVAALGHDARAIMPDDMKLEIVQVTGGGSARPLHLTMVDWAEKSMSKCLLGATLTSQADGASSTNALGQVHNEVRGDIAAADARQVAGTLTRDLVYPLLALNRGGVDSLRRCPRLSFLTEEPEDLKALAEALPPLVAIGVQVPASYVNERAKIPLPAEGEAVLGARVTPAPPVTPKTPAALAALAAGGGGSASVPDPVDAIAEQLAQAGDRPWGEVLDSVRRVVEQADSLDALQADLLAAYGGLPTAKLTAIMTLALASAELAGMADVVDGR